MKRIFPLFVPLRPLLASLLLAGPAMAQVPAPFQAFLATEPEAGVFQSKTNFETATNALAAIEAFTKTAETLHSEGFVIADKQANAVYVLAEASTMAPGEPVEFFITTTNSGYNYESIAVAYAPPGAIHRALMFIGCKPGWTVDYSKIRFWPRGDLVNIEVHSADRPPQPIEGFVQDETTTNAVAKTEFVFVGSAMVPRPGATNEMVYAADVISPQSIAANFNLRETVLDLPQQRSKASVYGQHFLGRKNPLKPRQPLVLVLRRSAEQSAIDLDLKVTGDSLPKLEFALTDAAGKSRMRSSGNGFADLLGTFAQLTEDGLVPHVDIDLGPDIPVGAMGQFASVIQQINNEKGVRIGPPVGEQLYFESYAPNDAFRDRSKRPTQPFELHLQADGAATLIDITETWIKGKIDPELSESKHPVKEPSELPALIKASKNTRDTLFVYAAPNTVHKEILAYLKPVREQFNIFFVFASAD